MDESRFYFRAYACADKHLQVNKNDNICYTCGGTTRAAVVKGHRWYSSYTEHTGITPEEFLRWVA